LFLGEKLRLWKADTNVVDVEVAVAEKDNPEIDDIDNDMTLLERLFDDENDDNIILFDAEGNEIELEQIAAVTYEDQVYAVLHVVGDPEEEVLVFRVNPEDEESVEMVEDEALGQKILDLVMAEDNK
jgi:hypothetical protein